MASRTSSRGINGRALGKLSSTTYDHTRAKPLTEGVAAPVFIVSATCPGAGTTTLIESFPDKYQFLRGWFVMIAAGSASDTAKFTATYDTVVDGDLATTTGDIGDAVDLSSAGDTDLLYNTEINVTYHILEEGGALKCVTAGGPTTDHLIAYAMLARVEE